MLSTSTRAKAHLPMAPTVLKILLCRVTKDIPLLWSFVLTCSLGKKNPEIDAELIAVPKGLNAHLLYFKGNEPTTPLDTHREGSQDPPQVLRLTNLCCQWLLYPMVSPGWQSPGQWKTQNVHQSSWQPFSIWPLVSNHSQLWPHGATPISENYPTLEA